VSDFRTSPLSCAVAAAEAGAQTVALLWKEMTEPERERWLDEARTWWPRLDPFLAPILHSAAECVANEHRASESDGPT